MKVKDALLRASVTASIAGGGLVAAAFPAGAADGGGGVNPNPSPQLPNELESKLNTLLGVLMGVVIFACVAGVIICAGMLAVALRRGSLEDQMGRLAGVGAACILVGSAAGFVTFLV